MGALTDPVVFRGVQVQSGDVLMFTPRGMRRLWQNAFLAIVDARDRSIPYLVMRKGTRVQKVPLDGAPYSPRSWRVDAWRHPAVDKAKAGAIAGKAAERPGEGVHHPSYDCGRDVASDEALVREAFAAAEIAVTLVSGMPSAPFERLAVGAGATGTSYQAKSGAEHFIDRGIEKTLPWQKRTRR